MRNILFTINSKLNNNYNYKSLYYSEKEHMNKL